ncbi:molybdate ABC transporter substrate-binding protein [Uliginosibacterium sp. H3]|uniref:Molybdate ABC transporter substrate-binding protein n=2 Tax=Uliginosibacterium silvisoli TaxID=3114758 RepID=A0ABU6JXY4_9RHOO|nr:molybdate ABC transporter substrate-binding protein [Uliginosibacterium sp. H3]
MKSVLRSGLACLVIGLMQGAVSAAEVQVAVAANFAGPFEKIAAEFAAESGHKAVVAVGATGKFYAQIKNGAPFEILLAADDETPRKLVAEGDGVAGSTFTYAKGKLVLWSAKPGFVDEGGKVLTRADIAHIAIANPKLAPYGLAAEETLKAGKLYDDLKPKFVIGESIAQTFQFVATGNAELGFVAMSQVLVPGKPVEGSYWAVPSNLYSPILQDAVLLKKGEANAAAQALLKFLKSDKAKAVIKSYGYDL